MYSFRSGLLLLASLCLVAGCGTAAKQLSPAELDAVPTLEPGDALVVLELESNEEIKRLSIQSFDRARRDAIARDLGSGLSRRLIVLPVGTYRWNEVDMAGRTIDGRQYPVTWRVRRDEQHFRFDVRPGVINYPGRLVLQRVDFSRLRIYTLNRGAQFLMLLDEKKLRLLDDRPIAYSGRGRDDFLEFYRAKRMKARMETSSDEPTKNAP